ncbi:long-chain-fatty-acid--CoA ligase [Parasphingorhabdus sp. JC815]|uniref:long-chain-fatty-acid--CoA ligase n=1 Tax=Parasphingorhabdus sp. JC815 TaxID=3232140 RepID=UPI003459BF40
MTTGNQETRRCMGSCIAYWAEHRPDNIAIDDVVSESDSPVSYAELDRNVSDYARAMIGSGLKTGDRICWLGKNSGLYYTLFAACSRAGTVMVPINWRLAAPEVAYVLKDTRAPLLICEPEFAEIAKRAAKGTDAKIIVTRETGGIQSLSAWMENTSRGDLPNTDPAEGVLQLYTSGTTGNPKGAVLSNDNLFKMRPLIEDNPDHAWIDIGPDDSTLAVMPVAHIAGSGIGPIAFYNGAKMMVIPEFHPDYVLDCVDKGLNQFFLVPTALQMLVGSPRAKDTDFSAVRSVTYGAAPIPLELLRQCIQAMPEALFCQQYGMTETTGTICILPPEDHDPAGNERMRGIGIPLPGVEMKIVDDQRREVPPGTIGEIATRSGLNMLHYFDNPEKTAETVDADGWLYTGDAAVMDEDGYFYIKDRVKDMIITGGENVYPAEVENAIFGHPQVNEVAVIGVPDEKWGEAVKVVVSPKPGEGDVDKESIISWARERIAGFKVPKSVDVISELPRNASGKILRRELRDPYWEGKDREVN